MSSPRETVRSPRAAMPEISGSPCSRSVAVPGASSAGVPAAPSPEARATAVPPSPAVSAAR
ncbi:hypothetical protein ACFFX0_13035 [Citricoccus parietis]|uniref:Uncharacterized protein n=1 Tax=Citricoccus parietis TaxID=592307 RepID=A0ABV5G090_9MICC